MITDLEIARALLLYGVAVAPQLRAAVRRYMELLLRWNEKVLLTSVRDPQDVLRLHFGESMFAAHAVPIKKGRLADVGSGAGFPGLPLRLVVPDLEVTLIESSAKKAAFLLEVVRTLELDRVTIYRGRAEDMPRSERQFDFITARAVGKHDALLKWARESLAPQGQIVLWLGAGGAAKLSDSPAWKWREAIPVPGSRRRVLLVGQPV